MNGTMNLWIVKPGGLSRGRNIRIFRDYQKILEYAEVDPDKQLSAATMGQSTSKLNTRVHYLAHQKAQNDDDFAFTRRVWVVQKYIENPMIIMNRKFDIRVWVIVPSWNPLRIYIWRNCYVRFACNDYDPNCPQNLFGHLTNNSVVKQCLERPDNRKMLNKIPGNMWSLDQFKSYLNNREERRANKSHMSKRSHSNLDLQSSPNKFS